MKNLCLLVAVLLTLVAAACKDKDTSIYADACGIMPTADAVLVHADTVDHNGVVVDTVLTAHVFIPNIFVPDGGPAHYENDYFVVYGGYGVAEIQSAIYSSADGEVLFSRNSILPGFVNDSWNGTKPDGTIYYGIFNYTVKVKFADQQTKTYTGKACAYKCGDPGFSTERLPDCFFPTQNNGNGEPDHRILYDKSCFE